MTTFESIVRYDVRRMAEKRRVPEWARAERLERTTPLAELWKLKK